jgi:hypothetical protein
MYTKDLLDHTKDQFDYAEYQFDLDDNRQMLDTIIYMSII